MDTEHRTRYNLIEDAAHVSENGIQLTDRNKQVKTIRVTASYLLPLVTACGQRSYIYYIIYIYMISGVGESYYII